MDVERTTIRMNRTLLARARATARERDQTFTAFIEDAVRLALDERAAHEPLPPLKFRGVSVGGEISHLTSNKDIWEFIEREEGRDGADPR
jgi:hypothetical protein